MTEDGTKDADTEHISTDITEEGEIFEDTTKGEETKIDNEDEPKN